MTAESLGPVATIGAIDGPAASGKSSVAKLLAMRLGVPFLNTGAMYRAVGRACHEAGVDHDDPGAAGQVAEALELDFDSSGGLLVGGQPWNVNGEQMGDWASRVAVHQPVREAMVARQRVLGQRSGCVAEGRDIGTVVFPAAPLKVFWWRPLVFVPSGVLNRKGIPSEQGATRRSSWIGIGGIASARSLPCVPHRGLWN